MSKKYLSLEEAALQLGIGMDELNRIREAGDIRGFADRGTWKFKAEDVDELMRRRQADSDPDVPLMGDQSATDVILGDEPADDLSEQPTIIRKKDEKASDSDVRLVLDDSLRGQFADSDPDADMLAPDSDSDVTLVAEQPKETTGVSDSDVKLVAHDSDSDVRLAPAPGSDSDVKLIDQGVAAMGSDSDVTLVAADEGITVNLRDEDRSQGSALWEEPEEDSSILVPGDSGIALAGDSGIALQTPADSGISLEAHDSGIALASGDSGLSLVPDSSIKLGGADSGLTLAADSGIQLQADSGISLDKGSGAKGGKKRDNMAATSPMLEVPKEKNLAKTDVEVPLLSEESDYELGGSSGELGNTTSVIMFDDDEADAPATAAKGARPSSEEVVLGESAFELETGEELAAEDEELEELDVFDAEDADFDESFETGESHTDFVPIGGGRLVAAAETEWSPGTFAGVAVSTVFMAICAMIMFDLVRSMWAWNETAAFNSGLVEMVSGLF